MSEAEPSSEPQPTARRWLRRSAFAVVAVEVGWLLVANLLLAGPLSSLLSRRPEKLLVTWDSAWSAYPAHVVVHGLTIRNQTRRMQMEIVVPEARGRLGLLPLLGRRIAIRGATGSELEIRARHRLDVAGSWQRYAPHMPPIDGLDNPPSKPPVRKRRGPPPVWTVSFEELGEVSAAEIWIDAFRVGPGLSARGSAEIVPRQHFVLSAVEARLDGVDASALGAPFARGLSGRGRLALSPIPMKQALAPGETYELPLDDPDLDLELDGEMAAAPLAALLTGRIPWFGVEAGSGPLSARLVVDDGVLQEGSRVDLTLPDLALRLTEFRLVGAAECRWRLGGDGGEDGDGWLLTVEATEIEGQRADSRDRLLGAEALHLLLAGSDRRLARYRQAMHLEASLERGAIDDLAAWNAYLPAKTGLALRRGRGTLSAHLEADTASDRGSAAADLHLEAVELDYFGETVAGRADAALRLPQMVLDERRYALAGSKLTLVGTGVDPGWEGTFTLEEGWLSPGRDPAATFAATLEASDARPAIALFLAKKNLPGWVGDLVSVQSLSGRSDLAFGPGGLHVGPFELEGDHVETRGVLALRDKRPDGLFYARYRALQLGLRVDGEERHVRLASPRRWFDRWMAERGDGAPDVDSAGGAPHNPRSP